MEGLGKIAICAKLVEQVGNPVVIEGGNDDDMAAAKRLDLGQEFQAVRAGHSDIQQDDIRARLPEATQCPVGRGHNLY